MCLMCSSIMGIYILVLCLYRCKCFFSAVLLCVSVYIDKGKSHMREFPFATWSFFCLSFINEGWTKDVN